MNKILVTGAAGMVGSHFVDHFPQPSLLLTPTEQELDITSSSSVTNYFSLHQPNTVIHFAAFTDVNAAEKQRGDQQGLCWQVNVQGTHNLVQSAKQHSAQFIHISTDMVFSGSKSDPGPYSEDHPRCTDVSNLTWYGYSKSQAEELIPESSTIIRLIYPVRSNFPAKLDYLRKPLQLFDAQKLYPFFSDQQVSLTLINDVTQVLNSLIAHPLSGVIHVSSSDTSNPHELISYLLLKARNYSQTLASQKLEEFLTKTQSPAFRYPQFGGLNSSESARRLKMKFGTCHQIIDTLIAEGITA